MSLRLTVYLTYQYDRKFRLKLKEVFFINPNIQKSCRIKKCSGIISTHIPASTGFTSLSCQGFENLLRTHPPLGSWVMPPCTHWPSSRELGERSPVTQGAQILAPIIIYLIITTASNHSKVLCRFGIG